MLFYADGLSYKKCDAQKEEKRLLGSVRIGEETPFDFFRVFYGNPQSIITYVLFDLLVYSFLMLKIQQ